MKITRPDGTLIEFDDNGGAVTTSDSPTRRAQRERAYSSGSAPKEQLAKTETAEKATTVVDTPTPGPVSTPSAPVTFTEPPPQSQLSTGTLYGGQPNISDAQKDNPHVFHFVAPREE